MPKRKQEKPLWLDDIRKQTTGKEETIDDNGVKTTQRRGMEILNPEPMAIPAGFGRPTILEQQVARLTGRDVDRGDDKAVETWEEANDFDVDDDFDPSTPFETVYDTDLQRDVSPEEYHKLFPQLKEEFKAKYRNHLRHVQKYIDAEEALKEAAKLNKREAAEGAAPRKPAEQSDQ